MECFDLYTMTEIADASGRKPSGLTPFIVASSQAPGHRYSPKIIPAQFREAYIAHYHPVLLPEGECPAPARPVDIERMSNRQCGTVRSIARRSRKRRITGCASQLDPPSEMCGRVVFHSRIVCGSAPFYAPGASETAITSGLRGETLSSRK
jgi:hypothetical protein